MEQFTLPLEDLLNEIKDKATLSLPDPDLLAYYLDYDNRHIYVNCEITDELITVSRQIIKYNAQDRNIPIEERKPIYLYVFSEGGSVDAVYSAIAVIEASQTPVITVNFGISMSAGMLLLLAGHKRFCLRRSQALIHSGSGTHAGTYEQVEEAQKAYKKMIDDMRDYILEKTKIDLKLFNRNKSKDWYISDQEQVELGIVDKIVDNIYEIV